MDRYYLRRHQVTDSIITSSMDWKGEVDVGDADGSRINLFRAGPEFHLCETAADRVLTPLN
jgi:hypothetical protein